MMPPPSTSSRCGTPSSCSAPVESTTRGSFCGMNGSVSGSEPAAMIACSKPTVVVRSLGELDLQLVRRGEAAVTADRGDLALFGQPGETAGEPADDTVLPRPQLADVDPRSAERDAVLAHLLGLGDDFGGVQEGFGRYAANVEADPAERRPAVHHHDLLAEVGGPERGRVAARSGTEDEHLRGDLTVCRRRPAGRRGRAHVGSRRGRRCRRRSRPRRRCAGRR